jgi:hypothetical protein
VTSLERRIRTPLGNRSEIEARRMLPHAGRLWRCASWCLGGRTKVTSHDDCRRIIMKQEGGEGGAMKTPELALGEATRCL